MATGLLVEQVVPLPGLPSAASWSGGLVLFAAAAALGLWFVASFRRANTPVDVRKPPSRIVTGGPFRFSHNPGYLSLTVMYLGLAVLADALWPLLGLPAILLMIERGVIEREESCLERKFGDEYLRYKSTTRRWI